MEGSVRTGRAHSLALQPVVFGADWGGWFASAPSAVPAIGFQCAGADDADGCAPVYSDAAWLGELVRAAINALDRGDP
jgi:hypothetical protein